MIKYCMFILTVLLSGVVFGQNIDFDKVSISELQEKAHPTDNAAVAAVLFSKGNVYFDYSSSDGYFMLTRVKKRIKIYGI